MKTLKEIKEIYAKSLNDDYDSYTWQYLISNNSIRNMEHHHDAVAKLYAMEVTKQTLINISKKSQEMRYYIDEEETTNVDILNFKHRRSQSCYAVPKQTILNQSNIPTINEMD